MRRRIESPRRNLALKFLLLKEVEQPERSGGGNRNEPLRLISPRLWLGGSQCSATQKVRESIGQEKSRGDFRQGRGGMNVLQAMPRADSLRG